MDEIYVWYLETESEPRVSRENLRLWYNGYQTVSGKRLYNPRSVVGALSFNQLGSYWTSSGPYDEIYTYIKNDISGIKDDIAALMSGTKVQAREFYDIRLEDRSGTGYVDYIFYPYKKDDDGIIIELKADGSADAAIQQIKDRRYALNFEGKLGEKPKCTGRILAVGIAYNRKDSSKKHDCRIEILRERLT